MQRALRDAVKRVKTDGAILAEADAGVFDAVSDATWDFAFGQNLLPRLKERPASEFVPLLRTWLHERQLTLPPGSLALRYVEIHDVLRARDVYGTAASVALGAIAACHGLRAMMPVAFFLVFLSVRPEEVVKRDFGLDGMAVHIVFEAVGGYHCQMD